MPTPVILGALESAAGVTTPNTLHRCLTSATLVTNVAICNTSGSAITYRLCLSPQTTFPTTKVGYLIYDDSIEANQSVFLPLNITLDASFSYLICSASAAIAFTAFGQIV